MKHITDWIDIFRTCWKNHDVDGVMDLFTDDVEYWETPFKKVKNIKELRSEWEYVKTQHDIAISCNVFAQEENNYAIMWNLTYRSTDNESKHYKGTYLLRLNSNGKCDYFFQCGESEN